MRRSPLNRLKITSEQIVAHFHKLSNRSNSKTLPHNFADPAFVRASTASLHNGAHSLSKSTKAFQSPMPPSFACARANSYRSPPSSSKNYAITKTPSSPLVPSPTCDSSCEHSAPPSTLAFSSPPKNSTSSPRSSRPKRYNKSNNSEKNMHATRSIDYGSSSSSTYAPSENLYLSKIVIFLLQVFS